MLTVCCLLFIKDHNTRMESFEMKDTYHMFQISFNVINNLHICAIILCANEYIKMT